MKTRKTRKNDWGEWRLLVLHELKRLSEEHAKIAERLVDYNDTNARNTASLEEHVKRTNLLEVRLEGIEEHVKEAQPLVSAAYWIFRKDNIITKAIWGAAAGALAWAIKHYVG